MATPQKLNAEQEQWLQEHLKTLPKSPFFDFERATRNLIADQGFEWVVEHEAMLR